MPPRLQNGDVFALVGAGQLDLPHGQITPLRKGRQRRNGFSRQGGGALLKEPWIAEAASSDHGHIRAGKLQDLQAVLRRKNIAVGDHGDGHRLLYLADGDPVRLPAVHLGAGAAVNGHRRHACLLQYLCQLHGVDAALVPTPAHLHRYRDAAGLYHRLGDTSRLFRILHQGRAVAVGDHLSHGAAHVDVDDLRAGHLRRDLGGLRHTGDVAAKNLGRRGMLVGRHFQQGAAFFVLIAQRLGADQLRAGIACPQLAADLAERHIRHPRHGGQCQPGRHLHISDPHRGISSLKVSCHTACPRIISHFSAEEKRVKKEDGRQCVRPKKEEKT